VLGCRAARCLRACRLFNVVDYAGVGFFFSGFHMSYKDFILNKSQWHHECGFDCGTLPSWLYDFQESLVRWSLLKGRSAIFADCGMGKTAMQLAWAQKVIERTNKPVLIVTPLAVGLQTQQEAERFGIPAMRSRDGSMSGETCVWITNYEQLHKLNPSDFSGVVCDESSAIKDMKSQRKATVVEFMRNMEFRLLCTATAAPNDYWELGTSSEALGLLGWRDMITKFFKQETSKDHHGWGRTKYRFRGHAEQPFWSWVTSWARSLQRPSDLGFDDARFILPPLVETEVVVESRTMRDGMLFELPATDMREEREERRRTIAERCEMAAEIANGHDGASVLWCELNTEGDLLAKLTDDCVQISGSLKDEQKEEYLIGFATGQIKRLVTKPKIGAWGMNWQHCHNVVMFPSHSFEQYYQAVRRCYRFGQKNPVALTMIVTDGERGIIDNLQRKKLQTEKMFQSLVTHMHDSMHLATVDYFGEKETVPSWL